VTSREFRERLRKRAGREDLTLDSTVVDRLDAYMRVLAEWNRKINLTAFSPDEPGNDALDRLLMEPLAAARLVPDGAVRWVDVGSGGGSPAIPLKVMRPAAHLTMVESKARKVAFLREVVRVLELADADVVQARFEDLAKQLSWRDRVDLVTVRAVLPTRNLLNAAAVALRNEGQILLFGTEAAGITSDNRFTVAQMTLLTSVLTVARRQRAHDPPRT
jgi:16S rRNA (guanine527-N7)-methyltransferase